MIEIHRNEEQRARNQIDEEHAACQHGPPRKAQAGQRIRGQRAHHDHDGRRAVVATISVLRR